MQWKTPILNMEQRSVTIMCYLLVLKMHHTENKKKVYGIFKKIHHFKIRYMITQLYTSAGDKDHLRFFSNNYKINRLLK